MANLRKEEIGFTQVKNDVLQDSTLSLKAKGLFAILFSKPDGWDFSADRLKDESSDGRKTILSGLKELENKGYLTRKRAGTGRVEYYLKYTQSSETELGVGVSKVPSGHGAEKDTISNTELNNNKEIYRLPEWLNPIAWNEWLLYKKERKQKMTPLTIKRQIKFLSENKLHHMAIIAKSIQNGWSGLFEYKDNKPQNGKFTSSSDAVRMVEKLKRDREEREARETAAKDNDRLREINKSMKDLADAKRM